MKRPIVFLMFFLILGILAGYFLHENITFLIGFLGLIIVLSALICIFYKNKNMFLFFVFLSVLGFLLMTKSINEGQKELLIKGEVVVKGVIEDYDLQPSGKYKAFIKCLSIEQNQEVAKTNLQIVAYFDYKEGLKSGQAIALKAELIPLSKSRNPGGFSEFYYYKSRKINAKAFPKQVNTGEVVNKFTYYLNVFKDKLSKIYDKTLPERESAIMKSMIIGETQFLDNEIKDIYKLSGIYHIISISGLHISVVAMCVLGVLSFFINKKQALFITILFLIVYCILTGANSPAVRATMQFVTASLAMFLLRDRDLVCATSFAAIVLLLFEPFYLFDIGFIYSFTAVFAIATLTNPINEMLRNVKIPKVLKENIAVSVAASLATTSVVLYFFYYFLPYSVIINLIIVPTAAITTISGFVIGVVGFFSIELATFISAVPFVLLKFYEYVCKLFLSFPFSVVYAGKISIFTAFFIQIILILPLFLRKSKLIKKSFYVLLSCFFVLIFLRLFNNKPLKITMLDVSQGDSFVINNKNSTFIIDGGGYLGKKEGENTGKFILVPYLRYLGVNYIDGVFVTHSDFDHALGIVELIDEIKIGKLFVSKSDLKGEIYNTLLEKANKKGIEIVYLSEGDVVKNKGLYFECMYPYINADYDDNNNTSIVLKLHSGENSFLFTGDIDKNVENGLLNEGVDIGANLLKLAHHGSKYSFSEEFFNEVSPEIAIVSAGIDNLYSHPSVESVNYFKNKNVPLFVTKENGAVVIEVEKESFKVTKWSEMP